MGDRVSVLSSKDCSAGHLRVISAIPQDLCILPEAGIGECRVRICIKDIQESDHHLIKESPTCFCFDRSEW
jgi:hypothetical protein